MTSTYYDVIVVGGGIIGLSAAYQLSRWNKKVLLVEQFNLPHTRGSSSGGSRLISRYSYPDAVYSKMVTAAYTEWEIIERLSGMELLRETGLLQIEHRHGERNKGFTKAMDKAHVLYTSLEGGEFHNVQQHLKYDATYKGIHEQTSGILRANKCIKALINLIVKQGGDIVEEYEVTSLTPGSIVTISNGITQYSADSVILAPGPWVNKLLTKVGITPVPVKTMPGFQFFWKMKPGHSYRALDHVPALRHWVHDIPGYYFVYGLPEWEYNGMMKVSVRFGPPNQYVSPDEREQVDPVAVRKYLSSYIREHLPFLDPTPVLLEPCMFTVTDDLHYIIDRIPQQNNIILSAGMSGHGFHSAPVIGQVLGEMALNKDTSFNIEKFSMKRFEKNDIHLQSKL